MDCRPYTPDRALDALAIEHLDNNMPKLSPLQLLLLAHSFSSCPGTQPDLGLPWGANLGLQKLVLEHAVPRWLDGYYPDSSGVSSAIKVTTCGSLPDEADLYWLGLLLTRVREKFEAQGGRANDAAYATWTVRTAAILLHSMNGLRFCTLDDGADVSLVGYCLTEDRPKPNCLGERTIQWIESYLPPGSGVGRALVASLERKGYLTTANDCVAESMGFWLKMHKNSYGIIRHK